MTEKDILQFCQRGNHEYGEGTIVRTVGVEELADFYEVFKCKLCPSRYVKAR